MPEFNDDVLEVLREIRDTQIARLEEEKRFHAIALEERRKSEEGLAQARTQNRNFVRRYSRIRRQLVKH